MKKIVQYILALCLLLCLSCYKDNTVENYGIFGSSREQSVIGQDGCTPIPLGNIMMWTFGDTLLGTWKKDLSVNTTFEESAVMKDMISNSLAFTDIPDDKTIKNLQFKFYKKDDKVAPFIKNYPHEDPSKWRFWPADGIRINSTVYVFYYIIFIDRNMKKQNAPFPFRSMGTGIAEWEIPESWKIGDPVNFKRTTKIFYEGEPLFGDCIEKQDDYLYIIGRGIEPNNKVPAYLARVRTSQIKDRMAYDFLNANNRWTSNINAARPLFNDAMGELSISYNEYLKEYVIIYCSLDGRIKSLTFEDFNHFQNENAMVLYIPPPFQKTGSRPLFYYSGKEIFHTQKGIYAIYINPAIYQPILLRIPYPVISE